MSLISGACSVKYLVCLVIDEAHRAMGNYSYCVAIREVCSLSLFINVLAYNTMAPFLFPSLHWCLGTVLVLVSVQYLHFLCTVDGCSCWPEDTSSNCYARMWVCGVPFSAKKSSFPEWIWQKYFFISKTANNSAGYWQLANIYAWISQWRWSWCLPLHS